MLVTWSRRWRIGATTVLVLLWLVVLYARIVGLPFTHTLAAATIVPEQGFGYLATVPPPWPRLALARDTDRGDAPSASRARLYENGVLLAGFNSSHAAIRARGLGTYSDWSNGQLYFSSSDNSDPRTNGRVYELRDTSHLKPKAWVRGSAAIALGLLLLWGRSLLAAARARVAAGWQAGSLPWARPAGKRRIAGTAALAIAAVAAGTGTLHLSGVAFWIAAFAALIFGLLAGRQAATLVGNVFGAAWRFAWVPNLALALASMGLCVTVFEGYLAWLESEAVKHRVSQESTPSAPGVALADGFELPADLVVAMERRRQLLSLPPEWEHKPLQVPGTSAAYSWHGVPHLSDENHFRRLNGPFPARRAETMRIMVVGDSMTYGAGIGPEWTYTAQLERRMQRDYRIEFINLGVNGAQSEDIAQTVKKMLPVLQPDLVIYGVCYNDFLPSGVGQYEHGYAVPLPAWLKTYLLERTRVAGFVKDSYNRLLLMMGISVDFFDDILKDFDGLQKRFAKDVKGMNDFVRSAGLPPVVGMPLDQYVTLDGRGHRISRVAERLMAEAGFDVISLEDYYRRYDGRLFFVSRWEGHPDEEANAIFASMLFDHLRQRPEVQRFRLTATVSAPSR